MVSTPNDAQLRCEFLMYKVRREKKDHRRKLNKSNLLLFHTNMPCEDSTPQNLSNPLHLTPEPVRHLMNLS